MRFGQGFTSEPHTSPRGTAEATIAHGAVADDAANRDAERRVVARYLDGLDAYETAHERSVLPLWAALIFGSWAAAFGVVVGIAVVVRVFT